MVKVAGRVFEELRVFESFHVLYRNYLILATSCCSHSDCCFESEPGKMEMRVLEFRVSSEAAGYC